MIVRNVSRTFSSRFGINGRHCSTNQTPKSFSEKLSSGPDLASFISSSKSRQLQELLRLNPEEPFVEKRKRISDTVPYIDPALLDGNSQKVFIETYGCQMNVNDTQIVAKILQDHNYVIVDDESQAEIVFLMTCTIRESAEKKIWTRLSQLTKLKSYSKTMKTAQLKQVGILGCMAERLKTKLIEKQKLLDIVAGPDSYKDLPKLLAINQSTGQNAINVLLSFDETYADVIPTHGINPHLISSSLSTVAAFISIMRGCDNMCTYCIVPFVRGKERSRDIDSILKEVEVCSRNGIKEITLLGQNVNSYRDLSGGAEQSSQIKMAPGFKTVYKPRTGGRTFDDLLNKVALIDPEIRIRFTSPHPKDFPEEFIDVIRDHDSICKCIHLPAQSGSNSVLEGMKRGYTRETYLELVERIKKKIPNIFLTSDFIAGFCGETEEDHKLTLDLINQVKYSFIYTFPYSMREKTKAYHHLKDDVPSEVKKERAEQIATLFRKHALEINESLIGTEQLVLIEKKSKRSENDYVGRCDNNVKAIFPVKPISDLCGQPTIPSPGDYVCVQVTAATSQTVKANPVKLTTLVDYHRSRSM